MAQYSEHIEKYQNKERKIIITSWGELCQAQVKTKVVVEVEFGVDVEAWHY